MADNQETASLELQNLKSQFETELAEMESTGLKLKAEHSRYSEQADEMIKIARRKKNECGNSMFSLALGAEFQGGKSTTVNAVADGREVCPRGNGGGGIRTSACAVRVAYSLNDTEEVSIDWKSPEQLAKDIAYWLGMDGMQITLEQLVKDSKLLPSVFDMTKSQLSDDAIEQLHDNNEGSGEKVELSTALDRTQQILMLISFYGDPHIKRWQNRKTFSREEAMSFLAFPEDNKPRWGKILFDIKSGKIKNISDLTERIRKDFRPQNAMYLFISMVNVYVPSDYLKSIGITVVDTPGMNISDSDTYVALQCMADSAAIFYLFSGEKELSNDDKKALMEIKRAKLADKVFFGMNFRKNPKVRSRIEESILADLQMLGYTAKHQKRLLHYNAFLAQRAKQGMLILSGKMNQAGKDKLMSEAKEAGCEVNDVTQAWIETTDTVLHDIKAEGWRDFGDMGLCQESVELVYRASQWKETMDAILEYVLRNKGRILLSDYIAKPVKSVLDLTISRLMDDEEAAKKKADDLVKIFEDAERKYKGFKTICEQKIAEWIRPDWDELIAEDIYRSVYERCSVEAAEYAAEKIRTRQTFLWKLGHLGTQAWNTVRNFFGYEKKDSELMRECKAIVSEAITRATKPLIVAWQNHFEDSTAYRNVIFMSVDNLKRTIKSLWQEKSLDVEELKDVQKALEDKMPEGKFSEDSHNIVLENDSLEGVLREGANFQLSGTLFDILKSLGEAYLVATSVAYIYLFLLPADFIVPFAAEIISAIWLIFTGIFQYFASDKRKAEKLKKMKQDLQHEFERAFHDTESKKEIIDKLAHGDTAQKTFGTRIYRDFYISAFKNAVNRGEKTLSDKLGRARTDATLADDERKEIAAEAKSIREDIIEPIQKRLVALDKKVEIICPETAI